MPDELVDRLGRAALVTSFPFFFPGRSAIGELFPTIGSAEGIARGLVTFGVAQANPVTRGLSGGIQMAVMEEIAQRALLDEILSFPSRAARELAR